MGLYQLPCTIVADTGVKAGSPLGRALPAGATVDYNGGITVMGLAQHVNLPSGLTLQMSDAAAKKITDALGPYTGNTPKKNSPDWVIS